MKILFGVLFGIAISSVLAQDLVRYDIPANNNPSCKVVFYASANYDFNKSKKNTYSWDGRSARGYIQGYGTNVVTSFKGNTSTTKANYVNGMEQGPGSVTIEGAFFKKVFLGTFKDGFTVQGTESFENTSTGVKTVYEGTFWNGERSGDGSLLYQSAVDKWKYVGKFLNNQPNGWGTQTVYARSADDYDYTWTGQFVNGKKNGTGRFSTNKGAYGITQWANDVEVDGQVDPPAQLTPEQLRDIFLPQQKIVPFNCTTYRGTTSCQ